MSDLAVADVISSHLRLRLRLVRPLRNRLDPLRHGEPGPERRVEPALEVQGQIPGREVLEEVGEVHVRATSEVRAPVEVRVAERLEIRDLRGAEARLLGRREAEEELRTVRDEVGTIDPCCGGHLLRKARPAVESTSDESFADARHAEQLPEIVDQRLRAERDAVERVAAKEHGDVVLLEPRALGIAREPHGVLEHPHRRPARGGSASVERKVLGRLRRHVLLEIRGAPRDRDPETGGRCVEPLLETPQGVLHFLPCLSQGGRVVCNLQLRRDDLVVERGHQDLDAVVAYDLNAVEQVLLGRADSTCDPRRRRSEAVDQLVDSGRGRHRRGGADDELLSGQPHVRGSAGSARVVASSGRGWRPPARRCTEQSRARRASRANRGSAMRTGCAKDRLPDSRCTW